MNTSKIKPYIYKYLYYLYSHAIDENNKRALGNVLLFKVAERALGTFTPDDIIDTLMFTFLNKP